MTGLDERVYLISGYGSFAAQRFSDFLLAREPECRIWLLVSPHLEGLASAWRASLPDGQRSRVRPLVGHTYGLDFGLAAEDYRVLENEVDSVVHFCRLAHASDERSILEANVGAARELIEFGRSARALERIVFVSSTAVGGNYTGLLRETELNVGQRFSSEAERGLAIAERMLATAEPKLPYIVVRPTDIIGDAETGEVNTQSAFYSLLAALGNVQHELVLPPKLADYYVHFVPVGFVLRAIYAIANRASSLGRTFHIAAPETITARRLLRVFAETAGIKLIEVPNLPDFARRLLQSSGITSGLAATGALAKPLSALNAPGKHTLYDTTHATEVLREHQIDCPSLEFYAKRLVDDVLARTELMAKNQRPGA